MKSVSKRKSSNYQVCYNPKNVNVMRAKSINSKSSNMHKTKHITPYRAAVPPQPIPSYLKREKTQNNNDKNNQQSTPLINDSYCIELRDQLMNEGIIIQDIEYNDLPNLSEHLREYAASKSYERDYTTAKEVRDLYDQVRENMKFRNTYNSLPSSKNDENQNDHLITEKINEQQAELQKFDEETEEKLQLLQQKHDEETEHFEKKWTEELPQSYRKQSSKLIQLFEIEKTLGLLNEFDKANQIKDEANKLEEEEMQAAQLQMESDYETQRSIFENTHRKEIENIEQTRKSQRDCLLARHKAELKKVENRINVLNDHQRQIKRPKESSIDIQSRAPVNSSLISIIRGVSSQDKSKSTSDSNLNDHSNLRARSKLLPPLIPPNDSRVKERKKKERRERIEKNRKFREKMSAKEREEDERYNESMAASSREEEDNCFDDMLKRLDKLTPTKNTQKKSQSQNTSKNAAQETSDLINMMIEKINDQVDIQPSVVESEENEKEDIKTIINEQQEQNQNQEQEQNQNQVQEQNQNQVQEQNQNQEQDNDQNQNQNTNNDTFNLTQSSQFRTQKD